MRLPDGTRRLPPGIMLHMPKHTSTAVGETTSDYAKRLACGASALARRVGPKRGIVALLIVSAGIGTAFVVRHLRSRRLEELDLEEATDEAPARMERRHQAYAHHGP